MSSTPLRDSYFLASLDCVGTGLAPSGLGPEEVEARVGDPCIANRKWAEFYEDTSMCNVTDLDATSLGTVLRK